MDDPTEDMADDLVLRIRLEGIRTNLEQVQSAKEFVAGRRNEIQGLERVFDAAEGIQEIAGTMLRSALEDCLTWAGQINIANEVPHRIVSRLMNRLQEAIEDTGDIAQKASASATTIDTMGRRWSAIPAEAFDRHVDQIFNKRAELLIQKIDAVVGSPPNQGWAAYRKEIRDQSDLLFADYVDFLGGLALRDTGLGGLMPSAVRPEQAEYNRDVCHMADDLIRQIYYIGGDQLWHSMAVPARRGTAARTISRMIRLGFPDWTVWAVPLAAFEFGLVVVDVNQLAEKYPDDAEADAGAGVPKAALRVVLADAFATYVMGPSYALASLLTRLEPSPAAPVEAPAKAATPTDGERVAVIFEILRWMDAGGVHEAVLDGLRQYWRTSLAHNGSTDDVPDQPTPRVAAWIAYIRRFLAEKAQSVAYGPARWEAATDWPKLDDLATTARTEGWQLRPQDDVRDILSAAWYQRIEPEAPSSTDLAVDAITLWQLDMAPRTNGSGRPTTRMA